MKIRSRWFVGIALILWASFAQAAFHLFRLDQLYSNADGSVQFVVILEATGSNFENFWTGQSLRATPTGGAQRTFTFGSDLPSSATANRRVLVATPGFAALGIVTPDYVMPANFLPINGGTVNYAGVSQITYAALTASMPCRVPAP
jgi:serralysin